MKQAVIFDFDNRIFGNQSSWRIHNPRAGFSGSIKDAAWAFQYWLDHRSEKGFSITDSLALAESGFVSAESLSHGTTSQTKLGQSTGFSYLPFEHVTATAIQHRIRSRQIYLLSAVAKAGIEQLLWQLTRQTFEASMPKSNLPTQKMNPVDEIELLGCNDHEVFEISSVSDLALIRFRRIKTLITIRDQQQAQRPGPFERIFVYTSDVVLAMLLDQLIVEKQDQFEAGRNALMVSLIVTMEPGQVGRE